MGVVHNKSAIDRLRELLIETGSAVSTQGTTLQTLSGDVETLTTSVGTISGNVTGLTTKVDNLAPNTKTIVLASSTDASEKNFAITVNDSGVLTATEIVEDSGGEE